MSNLLLFLKSIPELIKLFDVIMERAKEIQVDKSVNDKVKAVNKAFKEKNAEELRKIFNS
jgi:hypothetical protein